MSPKFSELPLNPVDIHIGWRLRKKRKEHFLTEEQLAERIGISAAKIGHFENGRKRIDAKTLFQIAATLEVPISYFFCEINLNTDD